MFCRHCGQENAVNAVQCIRCGESLTPEIATSSNAPAGDAPSVGNSLVWSILATLFCCLPTGIVAIVYAAQVNTKVAHGDIAGARESARNAAMWSWISFGLGLLVSLAYFGLVFIGIAADHH